MPIPRFKRILTAVGLLFSIAATWAFTHALFTAVSAYDLTKLVQSPWAGLVAPLCIYLLAFIPMSLCWIFLAQAAQAKERPNILIRIYLISQIAKYLPGNIGHLVGRVYMAERHGISPLRTGAAIGLELAATFVACFVLIGVLLIFGVVVGVRYDIDAIERFLPGWGSVSIIIVVFSLLIISCFLLWRNRRVVLQALPLFLVGVIMTAGAFLLGGICSLLILASLTGGIDVQNAILVLSAFMVSWLAGFVTPGSPAGIGVREFAFLSLLSGAFPTNSLALAIGGFRLVTIVGDLIAWIIGLFVGERPAKSVPIEAP